MFGGSEEISAEAAASAAGCPAMLAPVLTLVPELCWLVRLREAAAGTASGVAVRLGWPEGRDVWPE
jgi:hypothetical protein